MSLLHAMVGLLGAPYFLPVLVPEYWILAKHFYEVSRQVSHQERPLPITLVHQHIIFCTRSKTAFTCGESAFVHARVKALSSMRHQKAFVHNNSHVGQLTGSDVQARLGEWPHSGPVNRAPQ